MWGPSPVCQGRSTTRQTRCEWCAGACHASHACDASHPWLHAAMLCIKIGMGLDVPAAFLKASNQGFPCKPCLLVFWCSSCTTGGCVIATLAPSMFVSESVGYDRIIA